MTSIRSLFAFQRITFSALLLLCLHPAVSPSIALFSGLIYALLVGNPFPSFSRKSSKYALQVAVIGLGFGINLHDALQTGSEGIGVTLLTVTLVMLLGTMLGRWLRLSKATSYLVSAGTAICGGSAIAAISPIIRANEVETSVSLSTVFILNAIGLILFPQVGHLFHLSQHQFGLWAAIAIHDTSSVVGAGTAYGPEALKIATTVKLTRALWIIPLSVASTFVFRNKKSRISIPWFILLFFAMIVLNSYLHISQAVTGFILNASKRLLTITLFLIGAGLTRNALKATGLRPLLVGVTLWILISIASLWAIITIG